MVAILLCMYKTQSSLIINNVMDTADAFVPACWLCFWQGKSQVAKCKSR